MTDFAVQVDEGTGGTELVINDAPERPETLSPPERVQKQARLVSPANRGEEQPAIIGQPSGLVVDILHDGFLKIDELFHDLSSKVEMPFHQVVGRYTKQFSRMNTANFWNLYQRYSMANKDTELVRVPEADFVNGTPCKW